MAEITAQRYHEQGSENGRGEHKLNDDVGLQCGKQGDMSCYDCCVKALNDGDLIVNDPGNMAKK